MHEQEMFHNCAQLIPVSRWRVAPLRGNHGLQLFEIIPCFITLAAFHPEGRMGGQRHSLNGCRVREQDVPLLRSLRQFRRGNAQFALIEHVLHDENARIFPACFQKAENRPDAG